MNDDQLYELFDIAIEAFPEECQEAARNWLKKREVAFRALEELGVNIIPNGGHRQPAP